MAAPRVAVWIIGPPGAGKSTLVRQSLPSGYHVVDQDGALERALGERHMPLDMRLYDGAQTIAFAALRNEVTAAVWGEVPRLRASGVPLAFETTGDKPHLFRDAVQANADVGYGNFGIGLRCSLESCLRRNRSRARVLPDSVIRETWTAFNANLIETVYDEILGADAFVVPAVISGFHLGEAIARFLARSETKR